MRWRSRLWALIFLASGAASAVEVAPLHEEIATETYAIHGDSAEALAAAIRVNGPMAPWGQRVGGYTTADIRWWLRMVRDDSGCRLANADVRLVATVTSPEWVEAATGPAALRRRWPRFLDASARHEAMHLQLMREAGERMRTAFSEAAPAKDCATLEAATDDAARREIRAGAARNRAFDRRTRHGRTEGVELYD